VNLESPAHRIDRVAWSRPANERPGTPLVVALHGRGADEASMIALSAHLPSEVTVAAPRAPIAAGTGYAWFANRGIGRPVAESIRAVANALFAWLDDVAGQHTHVVVLGFSGGTAMGGGLLLARPEWFDGAALLSGTLPWDAGFDTSPGRLAGLPLLWSIDPEDDVIPRDLVLRSEGWLTTESGADLRLHDRPGIGHAITADQFADVGDVIAAAVSRR
jgi:phospholipase/carboxylesterase